LKLNTRRTATAAGGSTMQFAMSDLGAGAEAINAVVGQARTAAGAGTLRLRLSGVGIPKRRDVRLQIHVNCQKLTPELGVDDPSYVASCTFFNHPHEGHGGSADEGTVSFLINATRRFAELYGNRPLKPDEPLNVGIIAKALFVDKPEAVDADVIQQLDPRQVSFEVVESKA
jgi:hypothetical protein